MNDYVKSIQFDIDYLTLMATIFVAILGWIVALLLQRSNARHQHKIEVRYDTYKQFIQLHKEIQDIAGRLSVESHPPFILMDSCMIGNEVGLKTEQECVLSGSQKWSQFVNDLNKTYSNFSNKYVELMYLFGDWTAALSSLEKTKDILCKEIERLKKSTYINLNSLQMYSSHNKQDWRNWDKKEIEDITDSINKDMNEVGLYLHDFMVLIHNELLSGYFGKKQLIRKTLSSEYKVLTKRGIEVRLDYKMIKKMSSYKKELVEECNEGLEKTNSKTTQEYKEYLTSIVEERCPDCGIKLEVVSVDKNDEGFNYQFICGHGWKGNSLKEMIVIKELLKIQIKKKGERENLRKNMREVLIQ